MNRINYKHDSGLRLLDFESLILYLSYIIKTQFIDLNNIINTFYIIEYF